MTMGDRVAVLKDGILQQVDTPRQIYDAPVNAFVATFFGSPSMNIFPARIVDSGVSVYGTTLPINRDILIQPTHDEVLVGVRPEDLHLSESGIEVTVTLVEQLGAETLIYATTQLGGHSVVVRSRGFNAPRIGDIAHVTLHNILVFNAAGNKERLG